MKNLTGKLLAMLMILALIHSCSKDDTDDFAREFESIAFDSEVITDMLPDNLKNSDNSYAQQVVAYVESATDFAAFSHAFTPPENAVKVGKKSTESYTWSWNYDGTHIMTMYWTYSEDATKNYWDVEIQFNDGERYSYVSAWEMKDGTAGEIYYNFAWICVWDESEEDCENIYWKYSWSVDDSGNYEFTYLIESEDDEFETTLKYITKVNADGSGQVDYFFYDELYYHFEWDAVGNGSWVWYYGESEQSGTWSVEG